MPRELVRPVRTKSTEEWRSNAWDERHPSYAMIGVVHHHGTLGPMFGSALASHQGAVAIAIRRAHRQHDHGEDRAASGDLLLEVRLTHAQFVEMISRPNIGHGVPCSLTYVRRDDGTIESVPGLPDDVDGQTEVNESLASLKARGKAIARKLDAGIEAATAILKSAKVSQRTIEKALEPLAGVVVDVGSNLPFFTQQVNEAAQRVVSNARTEVDAFVTATANRLGFARLSELAQIEQKDDEETGR
jgi:hypothetical protein